MNELTSEQEDFLLEQARETDKFCDNGMCIINGECTCTDFNTNERGLNEDEIEKMGRFG